MPPETKTTDTVHPDEKAYLLVEAPVPNNGKWRRYQVLYVLRGDELALHYEDIGEAWGEESSFQVPGLWEHTVGELWDIADKTRRDNYWKRYTDEMAQGSTLTKDFLDYAEVHQKAKNRETVIGPGIAQQRSW